MAYPHLYPNPPFVRQLPYHVSYHPPYYPPFPAPFDPSVSLANPYIYDPTQVKHRRRTTPEQLKVLEDTFKTDPKPSPALRRQLSAQLGMSPRVLQVWFQNRRMKVKRLAKKQTSTADQPQDDERTDGDQADATATENATTSSTSPITDPAGPPSSDQGADTPPTADSSVSPSSSHPSPPPDLIHRRVSLPDTRSISPTTPAAAPTIAAPVATSFDALVDPGLKPSRSLASLQRLESHPNISLIASHNSPGRTGFAPIVPPSLPPSFRSLHHHSPSTPLTRISSTLSPMSHRPASFHVIPAEQHQHLPPFPPTAASAAAAAAAASTTILHQPYAFPPRPVPLPGPGPLPAADYSFGSPLYMGGDDDNDATSSEYTDHGYRSRFGSFASVVESDEGTASEWSAAAGGGATSAIDGRRPSWTGEVAEMLSDLHVNGNNNGSDAPPSAAPNSAARSQYDSHNAIWEAAYQKERSSGEDETTPPPAAFEHRRPSLPISHSSELAYALTGSSTQDNTPSHSPVGAQQQHQQQQQQQQQQHYPSPVRTQQARYPPSAQPQQSNQQNPGQMSCNGHSSDEMLELHHAMAGYADHPSVAGDGPIYFPAGDVSLAAGYNNSVYGF